MCRQRTAPRGGRLGVPRDNLQPIDAAHGCDFQHHAAANPERPAPKHSWISMPSRYAREADLPSCDISSKIFGRRAAWRIFMMRGVLAVKLAQVDANRTGEKWRIRCLQNLQNFLTNTPAEYSAVGWSVTLYVPWEDLLQNILRWVEQATYWPIQVTGRLTCKWLNFCLNQLQVGFFEIWIDSTFILRLMKTAIRVKSWLKRILKPVIRFNLWFQQFFYSESTHDSTQSRLEVCRSAQEVTTAVHVPQTTAPYRDHGADGADRAWRGGPLLR